MTKAEEKEREGKGGAASSVSPWTEHLGMSSIGCGTTFKVCAGGTETVLQGESIG